MMQAYRRHYPQNWEELSRQCKERAGWKCEHCGAEQYELRTSKRGNPYLVYLAAAHKWHDKHNPDPELIALCQSCHARHDWQYKQRQAQVRLEQIRHLQLLIERGLVTIEAFL
jgi:hypothetical protein